MKKLFILPLTVLTFILFSCSSDDDSSTDEITNNAIVTEPETGSEIEESEEPLVDVIIDNTPDTEPMIIETGQVNNLFADAITDEVTRESSGEFTKFDFETGEITDSETEWDIAFRTTTIAINGGKTTGTVDEPIRSADVEATIVDGIFSELTSADGLDFAQDTSDGFAIPTGSDNGWYNYEFTTNIISPIPGKVLVVKTRNGNYAKVEISSYYLDEDTSKDARYYTFDYVYNNKIGNTSFE